MTSIIVQFFLNLLYKIYEQFMTIIWYFLYDFPTGQLFFVSREQIFDILHNVKTPEPADAISCPALRGFCHDIV